MSMAIASLVLNFLIIGLLMATIGYCWVLNKRIKILQDGKSELANLLQYFDESTTRASESIVALQAASKKIGENMQTRIDKVNYLMDDLAFMIEKGNRLVDQLDANFAVNRARSRVLSESPPPEVLDDITPAEKPVIKPAPVIERPPAARYEEKLPPKEKAAVSLEAVLDKVIGRTRPANSNGAVNAGTVNPKEKEGQVRSSKTSNTPRSKAEQELLDMIRAGNGIKG
jgi:hypothetical protein